MKKLSILILVILFFCVYSGYANWGGGSVGNIGTGNFNAIGSEQIEMMKEVLNIELYQERARVNVEYLLHNTGDDITVKAGFPSLVAKLNERSEGVESIEDTGDTQNEDSSDADWNNDGNDYYNENQDKEESQFDNSGENNEINQVIQGNPNVIVSKNLEIENYQMTVNGENVPFHIEKGGHVNWVVLPEEMESESSQPIICWLVSSVIFKKGENKTVKITYESKYQCIFGGISDDTDFGPDTFFYFLSTGAAWKGPIKSGVVNIKPMTFDPMQISIEPHSRFKRTGNTYTWNFTNLEPSLKDNINVCLNNSFSEKAMYLENGKIEYYIKENDGKFYYDFKDYTVKASSTLDNSSSYVAQNVLDDDSASAWVEGAKGNGIGESLTLTLKKPAKVQKILIIPGYAKSHNLYTANNRVAELKIVVNDSYTITRSLYDDCISSVNTYQKIDLGNYNKDVKTIKLIITKVYQGTKYDDTCISDIILRKRLDKLPPHQGAR